MKFEFGSVIWQVQRLRDELIQDFEACLDSGTFIGGESITEFENDFGAYLGGAEVVAVGNGTDALELALEALNLPRNSKVIVPSNSFVATAEAVFRSGLTPVFVDHSPNDYGMDEGLLWEAVDMVKPSAVIYVPLYGVPRDLTSIARRLKDRGIALIEDCAQAHGASVSQKKSGTFGDIATFSFFPGKNLGALGDAGAVVTNSERLAERVRRLANHGRLGKFDHEIVGRNSRLDPLQAKFLSRKLAYLDEWNCIRRSNSKKYTHCLADIGAPIKVMPYFEGAVYHQFVIEIENRDRVRAHLETLGIPTGIHYPNAIPDLQPYSNLPRFGFASSESASRVLSLPVGENIDDEKIQDVVNSLQASMVAGG